MRFTRPKANISILVIFVLLAVGLIGVLIMYFVRQLTTSSVALMEYYKSYYLAKGGIEFGLVQMQHRGVGFQQGFGESSPFIQNNFPRGSFQMNIVSRSQTPNNNFWMTDQCDQHSMYLLSGGESIVIPLFRDTSPELLSEIFSNPIAYENIFDYGFDLQLEDISGDEMIVGLVTYEGNELYDLPISTKFKGILEVNEDTIQTFLFDTFSGSVQDSIWERQQNQYQNYIVIANPSENTDMLSFCLQSDALLPTPQVYISAQGMFGSKTVGLEAVYAYQLPQFLTHSYVDYLFEN